MHASKKPEYRAVFQPGNRSVFVLAGTPVFEAAARGGLVLNNPCGGNGTCGKCRVRVVEGNCPPSRSCRDKLSDSEIDHGIRLACQARIEDDCLIEVPEETLFDSSARILVAAEDQQLTIQPCVRKQYVEMPLPAAGDNLDDCTRLERALDQSLKTPLSVLRRMPELLRQNRFKGTAVLYGHRLLDFETDDTSETAYGIAFDLGSTTIVGTLLNLRTGREEAIAAAMNPQISVGGDLVSRILSINDRPEALEEMRLSVSAELNNLIDSLMEQSGVERRNVYELALAGNSAMQQIFCGVSPAALGEIPFSAAFQKGVICRASECGLRTHPEAPLYVFPQIGGFIGGDTVAGVMAALMHTGRRKQILIDIGTNGEIVLAVNGRLLAASTAAGPAFEGARIVQGMRAAPGAIEKVTVNEEDIEYNVIGDTSARGLCGTGLIDGAAELLRLGLIDSTGRLLKPCEAPDSVPAKIRERLIEHADEHVDFRITDKDDTGNGSEVHLYQQDIRELQLATAAIRAGTRMLLKQAEAKIEEIDEIMLAGAFGNFIRRRNARRIGLLPQVDTRKINFIGNAASMGAKIVLLSSELRQLAEKTAARTEHIELSSDPEFQNEFAEAMIFPEEELRT